MKCNFCESENNVIQGMCSEYRKREKEKPFPKQFDRILGEWVIDEMGY